jgi:hypothetical protein
MVSSLFQLSVQVLPLDSDLSARPPRLHYQDTAVFKYATLVYCTGIPEKQLSLSLSLVIPHPCAQHLNLNCLALNDVHWFLLGTVSSR